MENSITQKKLLVQENLFIWFTGKIKSDRHRSNMRFGMSVSMFRLNLVGMTPVVVLVM